MNILFLDLSTKSTGWCVSNTEDKKLGDYGCLTASSSNTLNRIGIMSDKVAELIEKYKIDLIVAEDVHPENYGTRSRTERVLFWLQGNVAAKVNIKNKKIDVDNIIFLDSSKWRSELGIPIGRYQKRDALKAADMKYVKQQFNIIANDDVCDAICLYAAYFNKEQELNWE